MNNPILSSEPWPLDALWQMYTVGQLLSQRQILVKDFLFSGKVRTPTMVQIEGFRFTSYNKTIYRFKEHIVDGQDNAQEIVNKTYSIINLAQKSGLKSVKLSSRDKQELIKCFSVFGIELHIFMSECTIDLELRRVLSQSQLAAMHESLAGHSPDELNEQIAQIQHTFIHSFQMMKSSPFTGFTWAPQILSSSKKLNNTALKKGAYFIEALARKNQIKFENLGNTNSVAQKIESSTNISKENVIYSTIYHLCLLGADKNLQKICDSAGLNIKKILSNKMGKRFFDAKAGSNTGVIYLSNTKSNTNSSVSVCAFLVDPELGKDDAKLYSAQILGYAQIQRHREIFRDYSVEIGKSQSVVAFVFSIKKTKNELFLYDVEQTISHIRHLQSRALERDIDKLFKDKNIL